MDSNLYLTEVDIHKVPSKKQNQKLMGPTLRSSIIRHSLFFEKLLVGDSQCNNNPFFRQLIWTNENSPFSVDCPQDLWQLVKDGSLLPVIRNEYGTLTSLRRDHESKNVEFLPTLEYTQSMDDWIGSKAETYNIKDVSIAFRERVLESLDDPKNSGAGKISRKTLDYVKNQYVIKQSPLLYNSLRIWMHEEMRQGKLTEKEYRFVDHLVADAYLYNVPISLNKNIDIITKGKNYFPISISMGNKSRIPHEKIIDQYELNSSFVLMEEALQNIPAEAILLIKKQGIYPKFTNALTKFREDNYLNLEEFGELTQLYLTELEYIYGQYLKKGNLQDLKSKVRKSNFKTIIKYTFENALAILSMIPFNNPSISLSINSIALTHACYGTIRDITSAENEIQFTKGIIVGRPNSMDKLYEVVKDSKG